MTVEYYTGWSVAKAVPTADSENTINFLYEELFCQYRPCKILTDNGTHFSNMEVQKFADYVNAKHQFSAPYHSTDKWESRTFKWSHRQRN